DEITLSVNDWGDRLEEVQPFLREWIRQRVHIERTKLKSSSRRRDPYWTDQWRRAHPWGGATTGQRGHRPGAREEPRHDREWAGRRGPDREADGASPSRTTDRVPTVRRDPRPRVAHPAPGPLHP